MNVQLLLPLSQPARFFIPRDELEDDVYPPVTIGVTSPNSQLSLTTAPGAPQPAGGNHKHPRRTSTSSKHLKSSKARHKSPRAKGAAAELEDDHASDDEVLDDAFGMGLRPSEAPQPPLTGGMEHWAAPQAARAPLAPQPKKW